MLNCGLHHLVPGAASDRYETGAFSTGPRLCPVINSLNWRENFVEAV